jgi:hypothetical protein
MTTTPLFLGPNAMIWWCPRPDCADGRPTSSERFVLTRGAESGIFMATCLT